MGADQGPIRRIVERLEEGAGCDKLLLECDHVVVKDHRAKWGKRTRCFRCRSSA